MAIVNDPENLLTIDTETGEFLKGRPKHYQDPYLSYTIYDKNESPLFCAHVRTEYISGSDSASDKVKKWILVEAWFPSGKPEKPTLFYGQHRMIDRLCEFLEVRRHIGGIKNPDPKFVFVDGRGIVGGDQ